MPKILFSILHSEYVPGDMPLLLQLRWIRWKPHMIQVQVRRGPCTLRMLQDYHPKQIPSIPVKISYLQSSWAKYKTSSDFLTVNMTHPQH